MYLVTLSCLCLLSPVFKRVHWCLFVQEELQVVIVMETSATCVLTGTLSLPEPCRGQRCPFQTPGMCLEKEQVASTHSGLAEQHTATGHTLKAVTSFFFSSVFPSMQTQSLALSHRFPATLRQLHVLCILQAEVGQLLSLL